MKIVEYKLHLSPAGMRCPGFIKEGGYWHNPDDHTMVGTIPSGAEYYVPDTVVELTAEELETRQLAIHAKYPMQNMALGMGQERDMTIAEVKTAISNWVKARKG